ncbi:MAG: segregation/condensation protein A [Bacilli bacterium]|nr:segregation/condensation protein A [Bacilli bacterium]
MDIEFRVNEFEGPLDLLLHLIKHNEMDIMDIEIDKITDQYLKYLDEMEKMNLEVTSNYLVIASELLYIKSKILLPNSDDNVEEDDLDDPRDSLVQRLLEYQAYKNITNVLKDKEEVRRGFYTKIPEDINLYVDNEVSIKSDVSLDDLVDAFKKYLVRQRENKPLITKVTEKEITVSDRKIYISRVLKSKRKVNFIELFEDYSKEYIVATFLAILEMAKLKQLVITQNDMFGEIVCEVCDE